MLVDMNLTMLIDMNLIMLVDTNLTMLVVIPNDEKFGGGVVKIE